MRVSRAMRWLAVLAGALAVSVASGAAQAASAVATASRPPSGASSASGRPTAPDPAHLRRLPVRYDHAEGPGEDRFDSAEGGRLAAAAERASTGDPVTVGGTAAAASTATTTAAGATFSLSFSTDFPAAAKPAFVRAAAIWGAKVTSPVPISVQVTWQATGGPYAVGLCQVWFSNGLGWCGAVVDRLADAEATSTAPDIMITLVGPLDIFYLGTDGHVPNDKTDLVRLAEHELGHGLGFAPSFQVNTAGTLGRYGYYSDGVYHGPTIYDDSLIDGVGKHLLAYTNDSPELEAALTSNAVFFGGTFARSGNGGTPPKIQAPSPWVNGVSISHPDHATFGIDGSPDNLMVSKFFYGPQPQDPGPVTMGILRDVGWGYPVARGGADRSVAPKTAFPLDGTGSTDPQGGALSYFWTQIGGTPAVLRRSTEAVASVDGLPAGSTATFRLSVTNPQGDTDTDDVTITARSK
jgi:hypothetical protein